MQLGPKQHQVQSEEIQHYLRLRRLTRAGAGAVIVSAIAIMTAVAPPANPGRLIDISATEMQIGPMADDVDLEQQETQSAPQADPLDSLDGVVHHG